MGDPYAASPDDRRANTVRRDGHAAPRHPGRHRRGRRAVPGPGDGPLDVGAAELHRGGRPGVSPARRRGARRGTPHDLGGRARRRLRRSRLAAHPGRRRRGGLVRRPPGAPRTWPRHRRRPADVRLRLRARRAGGPLAHAARELRLTAGGLEGRVPDRGGPGVGRGAAGRGFAPGAGVGRPAAAGRGDGAGDPMAHGADDRGRRDPPSGVPGRGCGEHARRARRRDPVLLGRPAHPGLVRRLAARAAQPERCGQHPDLRGRRRDHRPAARRRRHRPPRRPPLRGHGDPRLLAAARRARWWRGGEGARAAHPVCVATRRRRRAGPVPAHRRLRGRQPGVGSGAAASGVRARRHRATGHPGRRVGRRRPGVRPAGDRRPRRPTGPARPAPGDRDRAVPPAPLDVPGRPRRGRGSRPREPALHAAGRPPRRGDVPRVAAPAGARARTATSTSTGRSPTARPTTPSAT